MAMCNGMQLRPPCVQAARARLPPIRFASDPLCLRSALIAYLHPSIHPSRMLGVAPAQALV